MGPAFQNQTGFTFQGESKGSVQIANMILDGFRKPDVFVSAGTIPILKLANSNPPLVHRWIKFASAELVITYSPNGRFHDSRRHDKEWKRPRNKSYQRRVLNLEELIHSYAPKGYNVIIARRTSLTFIITIPH